MSPSSGKKLLFSPLLHCLMTGLALLWLVAEPESPQLINVTQQQVEDLKNQWQNKTGQWPSKIQVDTLVQATIENEIFFQEGVDQGLDQLPAVLARLQKLGSFLKLADTPDTQVREAELLGLVQTDPIVRKHIIASMQELLTVENPIAEPDQTSIESYYQEHLENYKKPALYKISQVFFSGQQDASKKRTAQFLQSPPESTEQAIRQGDVFFSGHSFPLMSQNQITKRLGDSFAGQLEQLKTGLWSGPVKSVYGWHAVMVHQRVDSNYRPLSEIKEQIVTVLMRKSRTQMLSEKIREFEKNYQISIEPSESLDIANTTASQQEKNL